MVSERIAKKILKTYEEAWVEQDTGKILSIFHKSGSYHEYLLKKPMMGHKAIRDYWQSKVVEEQSDIKFKLLSHYICKDTLIAEWDATFYSRILNARCHIVEVAIMKIKDDKIQSLREYWHSEKKGL
jgi:hypothetical protein